jgi:hypothetical protein
MQTEFDQDSLHLHRPAEVEGIELPDFAHQQLL